MVGRLSNSNNLDDQKKGLNQCAVCQGVGRLYHSRRTDKHSAGREEDARIPSDVGENIVMPCMEGNGYSRRIVPA